MEICERVNAAKDKIAGEAIWDMLSQGSRIVVAQNKKIRQFDPAKDQKQDIVAAVSGRTGNLRAPTLRIGSIFYVGFNEELYQGLGR